MKKSLILVLVFSLASVFAQGALRSITPDTNQASWAKSWWMPRHEGVVKAAKAGGAPVVFIGDSITHFWESHGKNVWQQHFAEGKYRAMNLGFSSDRTEHVLWRLANGELDGFEAKVIVLMIGTNNTGHFPIEKEKPEDTIVGVKAVLDSIQAKQPNAKIILTSIFPRGVKATDANRLRNNRVNDGIQKFADGQKIIWCDFGGKFVTEDGTLPKAIMGDALHPGAAGYKIWAEVLIPYLDFAMNAKPGDVCKLPTYPAPRAKTAK